MYKPRCFSSYRASVTENIQHTLILGLLSAYSTTLTVLTQRQLRFSHIPKHQTGVFPKLLFAIYTDTYYIFKKRRWLRNRSSWFLAAANTKREPCLIVTNYFLLLRTKSFFLPNTPLPPSTAFTEPPKENLEEPKAINGTGSGFLQSWA